MQRIAEELCETSPSNQSDELVKIELEPPTKMQRICSTSKCHNRTTLIHYKCEKAICRKCSTKVCLKCVK